MAGRMRCNGAVMNTSPERAPRVFRDWRHFLAFGLGSGLAPIAPGTAGTLAAVPFAWGLAALSPAAYLFIVLAAFALGVYVCGRTSRDLGVHDHGGIVWDEFVGYWITMYMAPPGPGWLIAGFALFRLFDVWKPWPIRIFDAHVPGGLGIMLDDVLAGLYAWVLLQALTALL